MDNRRGGVANEIAAVQAGPAGLARTGTELASGGQRGHY